MPEFEELDEQVLLERMWTKLYQEMARDTDAVIYRKVKGENIIFVGFGDGVTATFYYIAPNKWRLIMGEGDLDD